MGSRSRRRVKEKYMWVWRFLFDCLANVRRTKAYKQMAVEEVPCTHYVQSTCVGAGQGDYLSLEDP